MTVFIAHAEADRAAAEALEKFLERRGLFVELETGERGFRHVQHADTVVALWSKDTVFSPYRLLFEKRTMEAWADEQLVMVKLDHAFSPVGLRDLAAIDASFEAQRDIAWSAVAKVAQDARTRPAPAPQMQEQSSGAPSDEPPRAPTPREKRKRGVGWLSLVFLLLALLVFGSGGYAIYALNGGGGSRVHDLINRTNIQAADAHQPWLPVVGALGAFFLIGIVFLALGVMLGRRNPATRAAAPGMPMTGDPLFVSYSHADNTAVLPVVEAVQAQGRNVWIDNKGITGGEGWAGEIVRAIKGAKGVIVMCSKHAFESDHVKREVYLADRYKKPMVPVFLEAAPPPEDFEYFFADVQWLELHKTPLADRAAAIAKALKAV
ncbi:MAG: toll/interleukin-1 receptor domain-containing protein [Alphaproteobacteria bacterium]|nr:toll/interleukin-1 receptor domain-containing protein [Alphaproteobacteria bacterium]